MIKLIAWFSLFFLPVSFSYSQSSDSAMIRAIFSEALLHGKSYANLDYLSNKIGGRLSGSPQAAAAVEWAFQAMKEAGADTVYLQPCMVPHWVRGEKEQARIIQSKTGSVDVPICALGGSIGTGSNGLSGQVIEIQDTLELEKLGAEKIKGKIVFFNRGFNPTYIQSFEAYVHAVYQRGAGASIAARYGAIGVIVRSMTFSQDDFPHTGAMRYRDANKKIPACAISTNGANLLSSLLKNDPELTFYFKQSCETYPDVKSYNVIGELKGNRYPNELITVGGHLDSWDIGTGAHDDGAGVVQSIEVLRIFKALGIKPKRTIRAVAFMNEENGTRGGKEYAAQSKLKNEKHLFAFESDRGGFVPRGFTFTCSKEIRAKLLSYKPLFAPYGLHDFEGNGGGADIEPLEKQGVPVGELLVDSQRYFDVHHCANDVFSNVNKRELELGGASLAALIWLLCEHGL